MKDEINLIKIFEMIMKLWWVVLIFAVIGSLVAFSISTFLMTPQYTSNAKLYVDGTQRVVGTGMDSQTISTSRSLVATYIEILCGNTFRKSIAKKASAEYPEMDPAYIKGNITMGAANETEIIEIKYKDTSPEKAQYVLQLILDNAQSEITRVISGCRVETIDNATLPTTSSYPDTRQNTFLGMLIGIVLGIAIIFIRELLDTRVKDDDDLKTRYSIPVLGVIPNLNKE